jgi:acyl dehydratase
LGTRSERSNEASARSVDLAALTQLEFPIVAYEVTRERIVEYAKAIGDRNPVHHDAAAARALGHRDIVAPPTFASVFATMPIRRAMADPEWLERSTIDPSRILHGEQGFDFQRSIMPGDSLIVQCIVHDVYEKKGLVFLIVATRVDSDSGERILEGKSTLVLRP